MATSAAVPSLSSLLAERWLDPLERRLLLAHATGLSRIELITRAHAAPTPEQIRRYREFVGRRMEGEPIAYLTGTREFYGRPFRTTPDVLIPRPETELLVELALEQIPADRAVRVLELGTGTGAIAITLALERPLVQMTATDVSPAALTVARTNAAALGAAVAWVASDWYAALAPGRFDWVLSNPPYIAADDPHLSQGDLRFEPRLALTDEADGLQALAAIVTPSALVRGGTLAVEHGYTQGAEVRALFAAAGFAAIETRRDLAGHERITSGRAPG